MSKTNSEITILIVTILCIISVCFNSYLNTYIKSYSMGHEVLSGKIIYEITTHGDNVVIFERIK